MEEQRSQALAPAQHSVIPPHSVEFMYSVRGITRVLEAANFICGTVPGVRPCEGPAPCNLLPPPICVQPQP